MAILRQNAGADLTSLERRMFGEVLFQCLLLSKGQMALALAVVLQTEECAEIPGVFNLLYINQSVKVNFIGYLIVDFLRWIFYAAAKQAKLSGKMSKDSFRKDLSMPGLLREMRECFDRVPDLIVSRGITLSDCLMAGLAMFSLKIP